MAQKLTTPTGVTVKVDDKHAAALRKQGYKAYRKPRRRQAASEAETDHQEAANTADDNDDGNQDAQSEDQEQEQENPAPAKTAAQQKTGSARSQSKDS